MDMEQQVRDISPASQGGGILPVLTVPVETDPVLPPPEIIVIERPVYIPSPDPLLDASEVSAADSGALGPGEYNKGAIVYDYDADWVYEVYTQPLRLTDIRLEAGETVTDHPFVSDSLRWMLGASINQEDGVAVQHVYVKPLEAGLVANLIINTDRRTYHLLLRSYQEVSMPIVRWRYPSKGIPLPETFAAAPDGRGASVGSTTADPAAPSLDPRYLSFNYRITYGWFNKPRWFPELVYDDGRKTYISFPGNVLQSELPAVFENRSDVLNYRVVGNLVIIDKLIEKITVKLDGTEITIEKKRG